MPTPPVFTSIRGTGDGCDACRASPSTALRTKKTAETVNVASRRVLSAMRTPCPPQVRPK